MWLLFDQIKTIFAPPCLLCGSLQANYDNYCQACYQDLPHRSPEQPSCHICAVALGDDAENEVMCGDCLKHPPAYDQVFSALHYLPPVTALIHAFKDQGQQACGRLLSACLLAYLQRQAIVNPPQMLIPMPLHSARQRRRGFNQAEVIANHLGKGLDIAVDSRLCSRIIDTPSQQAQKKAQRANNLTKAFAIGQLENELQHIAIVDDVLTTGSSTNALAQSIRKACKHEIKISVWCLARTLPPRSQLHLTHGE